MNINRFRRWLGTVSVVAVGLLAGCAAQPTQTSNAGANGARLATRAGAPMGYGEASAQPQPQAPDVAPKLADAKPLDEDIPDVSNFKQSGRASWYGKRFNGRKTASGERYNMHAMTAAHKTLPLASYVRVTNTSNQKSVVVKINDRGPYVRGRVIDLSYAAARELGLQTAGTARVQIQGLTQEEAQASRAEVVASASPQRDMVPAHP
jgi:rare lipoprotein A